MYLQRFESQISGVLLTRRVHRYIIVPHYLPQILTSREFVNVVVRRL